MSIGTVFPNDRHMTLTEGKYHGLMDFCGTLLHLLDDIM